MIPWIIFEVFVQVRFLIAYILLKFDKHQYLILCPGYPGDGIPKILFITETSPYKSPDLHLTYSETEEIWGWYTTIKSGNFSLKSYVVAIY